MLGFLAVLHWFCTVSEMMLYTFCLWNSQYHAGNGSISILFYKSKSWLLKVSTERKYTFEITISIEMCPYSISNSHLEMWNRQKTNRPTYFFEFIHRLNGHTKLDLPLYMMKIVFITCLSNLRISKQKPNRKHHKNIRDTYYFVTFQIQIGFGHIQTIFRNAKIVWYVCYEYLTFQKFTMANRLL